MARRLDLPIPDFAILNLDVAMFRKWCGYQANPVPEIVTEYNSHVFASLDAEGCKDVVDPQFDLRHIDKALLARVFLFDRLIHNTDRTDFNSNLLVNGHVYIIDHNNAFDPGFSAHDFETSHILRAYRDAMPEVERAEFLRKAAELANGAFLEEAWSEMPEEWIDIGNDVLPLSRIRDILKEGCDADAV